MRKEYIAFLHLVTALCLVVFVVPSLTAGAPVINNITYVPSSSLWIGEDLIIKVNCTDDVNHTITNVMAEIVGQNGYIIPNKTFIPKGGGLYEVLIKALYMYEPNVFDVNIYCTNNTSAQTTQHSTLIVYDFSAEILSKTPIFAYTGSKIELNLNATKNNASVLYDVGFDVKIDGEEVQAIIDPPYDPKKGWIVYIDSPSTEGEYELEVLVSHDRINDTVTAGLTVKEGVQFYITSIEKTLIESHEKINVDLKAFEGSSIISLSTENLGIRIDSSSATIESITPVSDYFRVKIEVPGLYPGSYPLTASLKRGNYTYEDSKTVHYAVPISGEFINHDGNVISAEIKFLYEGSEKLKLSTSTDGKYLGKIQPATYDIRFAFPEAVLELDDIYVSEFKDPLNYHYFTSGDVVTGLKIAGLHVFETTLSFSKANIEMKYDETKILDENKIKVYRCANWNAGKKECYGKWSEVGASIDTVKNVVKIENYSLSAYAIGTIKSIVVDFQFDKEKYFLSDFVRIIGTTKDSDKYKVDNVSLRLRVSGTSIDLKARSGTNGNFSFEFVSPDKEGTYELLIDAEKPPYVYSNSSVNFEVAKSITFSIVFPETVQIRQGEQKGYEILLKNIGQTDLYDFNFSLTGLPEDYYVLPPSLKRLGVGEDKKVTISFSVPINASIETRSATLRVSNKDLTKEKIFGFTVLDKSEPANQTTTPGTEPTGFFGKFGKIIGKIVWPKIAMPTDSVYVVILLLATGSFTLAFLFRRKKVKNIKKRGIREEVRGNLFDLKSHIDVWGNPYTTPNKTAPNKGTLDPANDKNNNPSLTWNLLKEKWLNGNGRNNDDGRNFDVGG